MASAGLIGSGAAGLIGGAMAYGALNNQSYDQLSMDPNLVKAQQSMATQAQDFSSNLPGYQQMLYTSADEQGRGNLASGQQQIDKNYGSRGLLYSGLRQGAQAGNAAGVASQLANQRTGINQSSQNTANNMNQGAIQQGLANQSAQQQMNAFNYQQQMGQFQGKQQAAQQTLGGAMSIAGGLLGA